MPTATRRLIPWFLTVPCMALAADLPEVPVGVEPDSSWSVYVLESWSAPLTKVVGEIQEAPGIYGGVSAGPGDTLAVCDGFPDPRKPAIVLYGEKPVRGDIGLYSLHKLKRDSEPARDYLDHLQRALQARLDTCAWSWPEGGLNLVDSIRRYGRSTYPWRLSLEPGTDWMEISLKQYERHPECNCEVVKKSVGWTAYEQGFFDRVLGSIRGLFEPETIGIANVQAYPRQTGVWVSMIDLEDSTRNWSRRLKASGKGRVDAVNEGAWFRSLDGFLWVYGREAGIRYMELLDQRTGATLAHRIVGP